MLCFLALSNIKIHKCVHDDMNHTFRINENILSRKSSTNSVLGSSRESIRVVYNISHIINETDTKMCKSVGDTITWSQGTFTCKNEDLITDAKKQVITETFDRLTDMLKNLLKVYPLTSPLTINQVADIEYTKFQSNSDLFVGVVARPYATNSETLAQATYTELSSDENRPVIGAIYINAAQIPEKFDGDFFTTVFHETCHILGISVSLYSVWRNPETGIKYSPLEKYTLAIAPGKQFVVENGPYAHKYAVEKYGLEYMAPGVKSGILIEDMGGEGTKLSHPKNSVYFTEVMTGVRIQIVRISNLTFSMLEDTGFYDVNFSMAEPFAYGIGESMGIDKITNFTIDPPQQVFPSHYLCSNPNEMACSWDHLSGAQCDSATFVNCSNPQTGEKASFCEAKAFYDPKGTGYMGTSGVFDYQIIKYPYSNFICTDEEQNSKENAQFGNLFGNKSMCAMSSLINGFGVNPERPGCFKMTCDENGELSVYVDRQRKVCSKKDESLSFYGYLGSLKCPDPKLICSMKSFLGYAPEKPSDSSFNILDYAWLTISLVAILIIIIFVIATIICKCQRKKKARKNQMLLQQAMLEGYT